MSNKKQMPQLISISAVHKALLIGKPFHPLVSVIRFSDLANAADKFQNAVSSNFYAVSIKRDFDGKCKYGQHYYDFDGGVMTFIAPNQVFHLEDMSIQEIDGWVLIFHPDFLHGTALAKKIKEHGYFSYGAHEALHLSNAEETLILTVFANIDLEISSSIDAFTQDLIVSQIEVLLTYCDRFYNRQFITRKKVNSDILTRFESLLTAYFNDEKILSSGLPTVQFVAAELNLSPNYLSDMLKAHTGQTTQQHIQNKLIETAKEMLSTTNLSVSEIAYNLGFEHPQSFHRLFKSKTEVSPRDFRQSFN